MDKNRDRNEQVEEMLDKLEGGNWENLVELINSEAWKNLPPVEFPTHSYNPPGQQIEVYHSDQMIYGEWIDHNLTVFRNSKGSKIIGYEITDIFGLLYKCFGKELTIKIKQLIEDHCEREENERQRRREERRSRLS